MPTASQTIYDRCACLNGGVHACISGLARRESFDGVERRIFTDRCVGRVCEGNNCGPCRHVRLKRWRERRLVSGFADIGDSPTAVGVKSRPALATKTDSIVRLTLRKFPPLATNSRLDPDSAMEGVKPLLTTSLSLFILQKNPRHVPPKVRGTTIRFAGLPSPKAGCPSQG